MLEVVRVVFRLVRELITVGKNVSITVEALPDLSLARTIDVTTDASGGST